MTKQWVRYSVPVDLAITIHGDTDDECLQNLKTALGGLVDGIDLRKEIFGDIQDPEPRIYSYPEDLDREDSGIEVLDCSMDEE